MIKRMWKLFGEGKCFLKGENGGIVVEASLILPFFLSFFIALNCLIQVSKVEMGLQTAVSETVKDISTHMYPVRLLYIEAKQKTEQSKAGILYQNILDKVNQAKEQIETVEGLTDQFARFIPDSIVALIQWEKTRREELENKGKEQADEFIENTFNPVLNQAFKKIVLQYADPSLVHASNLKVTKVTLSNLEQPEEAFIGIEAQYDYKLPIPFINKTIHLRKRAYERAWIGS